jgi:hypothetical protein
MSGHDPDSGGNLPTSTDTRPDAEKLVTSLIPYARDDARARYLGLRSSGFTIREALKLLGYSHPALSKWRLDPTFAGIENRLPEFRKELSLEYANLEFIRNYRLVLEKDFRILKRSLNPEVITDVDTGKTVPLPLDKQDQEYLLKMRTFYTPQQLQIIQTLVQSDGDKSKEFDFTDFVIQASKIEQHIRVESKGHMPRSADIVEVGDNGEETNDS